jgi:serine protease AprX
VISVLAPGCTLATNFPKTLVSNAAYETLGAGGKSGDYFELSGTSMAAPVVAGAAALLIQKQPSLTPDQIKARLMKTSTKALNLYSLGTDSVSLKTFNNQSDIFTVGAGYLNIAAALTNNDLVTMPALSPIAIRNPVTRKITISRNFMTSWGPVSTWNDASVWGNIVFSVAGVTALDESVLWGDTVIWGQDESVLWGDSVNANTALQALAADGDDQ